MLNIDLNNNTLYKCMQFIKNRQSIKCKINKRVVHVGNKKYNLLIYPKLYLDQMSCKEQQLMLKIISNILWLSMPA